MTQQQIDELVFKKIMRPDWKPEDGIPLYSSSITYAMEVWKRLRDSGEFCCLNIYSDYMYCWKISINKAMNDENDSHEPFVSLDGIEGGLDGLAWGICMAALKAYGVAD